MECSGSPDRSLLSRNHLLSGPTLQALLIFMYTDKKQNNSLLSWAFSLEWSYKASAFKTSQWSPNTKVWNQNESWRRKPRMSHIHPPMDGILYKTSSFIQHNHSFITSSKLFFNFILFIYLNVHLCEPIHNIIDKMTLLLTNIFTNNLFMLAVVHFVFNLKLFLLLLKFISWR